MSEERKALAAAAWQRVEQLADEVIKWSAYVRQCEQAGVDSAVLHQEFQAKMEAFKREPWNPNFSLIPADAELSPLPAKRTEFDYEASKEAAVAEAIQMSNYFSKRQQGEDIDPPVLPGGPAPEVLKAIFDERPSPQAISEWLANIPRRRRH